MQDRVMATSIRRIRVASLSGAGVEGVGRRLWEGRGDWKRHGRSGGEELGEGGCVGGWWW